MHRFLVGMLALVACSGPENPDIEPTTDSPDDTGDTGTSPGTDQVSCTNGQNPLVIECSASLVDAGPVTLTLSAEGLETRIFESTEAGTEHELFGWGLRAETEYTWELAGKSGTLTTGALANGLSTLDVQTTGDLFGIDAVLLYVTCGWFVMLDGEGEVIWGIPTDTYDALSDGMMWSQADRSVIAVRDSTMSNDSSLVVENAISGDEVLRLEPGDFELDLTHDVGRWGPYTYLLGETPGREGGFEVWEGTSYLGTWMLSDGFPTVGNLEMAHINGLSVTDGGEVVLSVFGFDGVIGVDGDPSSAGFLQMQWHAAGEPGGSDDLPSPDYLPPAGDLFVKQHNASRHGDTLWVFDNQSQASSRALQMSMDHANGLLIEEASYSIGQTCINQGGAMPIDGGVLVTCANTGDVYAFRDGSAAPEWTLQATCDPGGPPVPFAGSTRAFPVLVE